MPRGRTKTKRSCKTLIRKIKKWRHRHNFSQVEMAHRLEIPFVNYRAIEQTEQATPEVKNQLKTNFGTILKLMQKGIV